MSNISVAPELMRTLARAYSIAEGEILPRHFMAAAASTARPQFDVWGAATGLDTSRLRRALEEWDCRHGGGPAATKFSAPVRQALRDSQGDEQPLQAVLAWLAVGVPPAEDPTHGVIRTLELA